MVHAQIRHESATDVDAIREVNRLAFGQDAEGPLVDRLRDEGYVRVSLVAETEGASWGTFSSVICQSSRAITPFRPFALAPMAVAPGHQRQGIGSALVRAGLEGCRAAGFQMVIVLGHRAFYPQFGFAAALARQIQAPYAGEDFMAMELEPGALAGVRGAVRYPPPFAEV